MQWTNAELAAIVANRVLPRFDRRIAEVDIAGGEKWDPSAQELLHSCETPSEVDVAFGLKELLVQLSKKGRILMIDAPEPHAIGPGALNVKGQSATVARYGKVSFGFLCYWDINTASPKLEIRCWYRPASIPDRSSVHRN